MKEEINLKYSLGYCSFRENVPDEYSMVICKGGLCELVGKEGFGGDLCSDEIKIVVSDKNPKKRGWKKISVAIDGGYIEFVSFLSAMTNKKVLYVNGNMYIKAKKLILHFIKGSLKKNPKKGNYNIWIKIEKA